MQQLLDIEYLAIISALFKEYMFFIFSRVPYKISLFDKVTASLVYPPVLKYAPEKDDIIEQ